MIGNAQGLREARCVPDSDRVPVLTARRRYAVEGRDAEEVLERIQVQLGK